MVLIFDIYTRTFYEGYLYKFLKIFKLFIDKSSDVFKTLLYISLFSFGLLCWVCIADSIILGLRLNLLLFFLWEIHCNSFEFCFIPYAWMMNPIVFQEERGKHIEEEENSSMPFSAFGNSLRITKQVRNHEVHE